MKVKRKLKKEVKTFLLKSIGVCLSLLISFTIAYIHDKKSKEEEVIVFTSTSKDITPQSTLDKIEHVEIAEPVESELNISQKYSHLYSENNLYLLAKIIQCEEGTSNIEEFDSKVLVGLVVLNRAITKGFPDTIEGVIFQKNQFQPTFDGSWNKKEPMALDYEAAKAAFEGYLVSEKLNQSTFFMDPRYSDSDNVSWFRNSLTYLGKVGSHEFYK